MPTATLTQSNKRNIYSHMTLLSVSFLTEQICCFCVFLVISELVGLCIYISYIIYFLRNMSDPFGQPSNGFPCWISCLKQNMRNEKAAVISHTHTLRWFWHLFLCYEGDQMLQVFSCQATVQHGVVLLHYSQRWPVWCHQFTGRDSTCCLWVLLVCWTRMSCEVQLLDTVNE